MNKKSVIKKQIAEAAAKLARLRESAPKKTTGVAYLIETEMEKYQLILSAKAIPDRLQDFAERIAKIEADDLMPVVDEYRKMFGKDNGERFHRETVGALRALMDQVQKTKDTINNNIENLESGSPMNDMANGIGMDDGSMGGSDIGDGADLGAPDAVAPDAANDMGDESDELAANANDEAGDDLAANDAAPPPAPEPEPGLGRARKVAESALKGKRNPDAIVVEAFIAEMKKGRSASTAAKAIAERFVIDVRDVKEIVKDAASR